MTPRQIRLVTETLGSLDLDILAADFYRRVFETSPHLATMFTSDPALQRSRFATELATMLGSIRGFETFCSSAEALGVRHRGYGARAAHYGLMGTALMASLAAALGTGWTADVEDAWMLAYNLTAETMMAGAMKGAPPR